MKQQQGIALITILVMVALATILAATIAKRQANTAENTAYLMRQNQSLLYAKSAEVFFSELLVDDANNAEAVYLGRPWRIYAKTVFIDCELGKHIKPEGWENWSKPDAEKKAFYAEYNNSGEGFQPKKRVSWSHQLTKTEAEQYLIENILKDTVPNWYF